MPSRLRGSRNIAIDRRIPGVGRLYISARTDNKVEYRLRDGLITKLVKAGNLETLRLLKRGTLTILDLVDADREGRLTRVTQDVLTFRPLQETFEVWVDTHPIAEKTRKDYRGQLKRFQKLATGLKQLPPKPTIADLARVNWGLIRQQWPGTDFDWSNLRIALSSFLGHALNRSLRPFRQTVMDLIPPAKLPRHKQTFAPEAFWQAVALAPEPLRPTYVAMAVLGVGPAELAGISREDLNPARNLVHVRGTKNRHRDRYVKVDPRLWPTIDAAIPLPIGEQMLRRHWNAACQKAGVGRMRLYDLRHLSGQSASAAGVPLQDIAKHMGHAQLSTTMWYLEGPMIEAAAKGIADTLLSSGPDVLPASALRQPDSTESSDDPTSSGQP